MASKWLNWALSLALALAVALRITADGSSGASGAHLAPPLERQVQRRAATNPILTSLQLTTTQAYTASLSLSGSGVMNISSSTVMTQDCYKPGATKQICFTVYNGSSDGEWLDLVRLTFPDLLGPWAISCASQDATDSSGNPAELACNASGREVIYTDNDSDSVGEITAGSSWSFCVDVAVPGGYNGERIVQWGLDGDQDGGEPHHLEGSTGVEMCTPLMFKPSALTAEGCNGIGQLYTLELWNNTGSAGTFGLTYDVPSGNGLLTGPDSVTLAAGEIVTFTVELEPDLCTPVGEQVTGTVGASGNGAGDSSTIVSTISSFAGWWERQSSPTATMDNVVVWASHQDGGLWSIGGYGTQGATQRYNPETNTWVTHTADISPTIEYPMDGCYGLNELGHEVVVLFPDTILTGTLHIYDITSDGWYTETVPEGFPDGRWGQDVVSLLNVTGDNLCYISGGATQEGGGNVKNLWQYRPDLNQTIFLGNFSQVDTGFNFHASWHVPWIGPSGAICVGGGIDFKSQVVADTQCYDIEAQQFNAVNADLGQLPEPWWGMADGWQVHEGRRQIWIANGVAGDGTLIQASAYADETTGGFVYGPKPTVGLYRLEGDGWMGRFFTEGGAAGAFSYSDHNLLLYPCPECLQVHLPSVLRAYGP